MKNLIIILIIAVMASSCGNPSSTPVNSNAEVNKSRMQLFYDEVINKHSTAAIDSFCMPDFVDHNPDPSYSGKGIDDLKASFNEFLTAYPDLHVTTNFMIAQGDTVMAYVTMTGTNTGALGNMPATNKKINFDGFDVVVIKDGKATERWGMFDNMKMMMQLGMMPGPGATPDSTGAKTDSVASAK